MRITGLLASTAPRESWRIDVSVARLATGVAGLLALFVAQRLDPSRTGVAALKVFVVAGIWIALPLAIRCGGDSVGDQQSGLLDLLRLSGISPLQWTLVRVIQMSVAFLATWMIRVPILVFLFTMGGIRLGDLAIGESLILFCYAATAAVSLASAHSAPTRRRVIGMVMLILIGWEVLWSLPVIRGVQSWIAGVVSLSDFLPMTISCGVLVLGALLRFRHLVATDLGPARQKGSATPNSRAAPHPRPRCWSDAIAWQAYALYGGGRRRVVTKCVTLPILALSMAAVAAAGFTEVAIISSSAVAVVLALSIANKPSDCLFREVNAETLPLLFLTPHTADELFAGWRRGTLRLAWPDFVFTASLCLSLQLLHWQALVISATIAVALFSSGPFLMLSPLVPISSRGITTAWSLIVGLLSIAIAGIISAVTLSPLIMPFVVFPLLWGYNRVVRRRLLSYWLHEKVASMS